AGSGEEREDVRDELIGGLFAGVHEWLALARLGEEVLIVSLGAIDASAPPETLASAILLPLRDATTRAKRIVVAPYGEARRIDVHALPWEIEGKSAPLLAHAPVVYTIDRGGARIDRPDALERSALVVGDPTSGP